VLADDGRVLRLGKTIARRHGDAAALADREVGDVVVPLANRAEDAVEHLGTGERVRKEPFVRDHGVRLEHRPAARLEPELIHRFADDSSNTIGVVFVTAP